MIPSRTPTILSILCAAVFLCGNQAVQAGNPIGDFFKKVGNSISHPQNRKTSQAPLKPVVLNSTTARRMPGETGPIGASSGTVANTPTALPSATPPPVRSALRAPQTTLRRDLPYGVPVPNKPGLVTSPYSPTRGFVDVRGFPSGTEVKDPYTDKIFLAP